MVFDSLLNVLIVSDVRVPDKYLSCIFRVLYPRIDCGKIWFLFL